VITRVVSIAALCALTSCAHSVLVHDDPTYREAIARYQRTRHAVEASLASDDDRAMFMQAEALYRYRFEPPGRSVGAYVAQATASLIDLPVLDSLSGSLDLFSVRLRMNDGAVQLWESLLAKAPTTPLRPLALYRLGWAYRGTLAGGLPSSSDEAFDALVAKHASDPLAALARDAKQTEWKSQGAAAAWSIFPGLGQMYAGEYASGAVRVAIALGATAMIVLPSVRVYERRSDLSWHNDWPLLLTGIAGATLLTIDYSSSYADALRAALEFNERSEREFEHAHPTAP